VLVSDFADEARIFLITLSFAFPLSTQAFAETEGPLVGGAVTSAVGAENAPPDLPGFVGCPTRYVAPGAPPPRISALTESPRFEVGKGVILGCYFQQRWNEDWSFLRDDPSRFKDFWNPVKFIRLNEDGSVYLTLSGQERYKYNYYTTKSGLRYVAPFEVDENDLRSIYGADLHVGPNFRAFVNLVSAQQGGARYGPAMPTFRNQLDLLEGFVEPMARVADGDAGVRIGRQQVWLGNGLLFATREQASVPQAVDGVRAYFDDGSTRADIFAFYPVTNKFYIFDDSTNRTQFFVGGYGSQLLADRTVDGSREFVNVDPLIVGSGKSNVTFGTYKGYDGRTSVGARLWGTRAAAGAYDFDWTGVYQAGHLGNAAISAFGIFTSTGYTFDYPMQPRIGVRFDAASGGQGGGTVRNYYPMLFAAMHFGENPFIAPINLYDAGINFQFNPWPTIRIIAYDLVYWRYDVNDAIYQPSGIAYAKSAGVSGRYIGQQPALKGAWAITDHFNIAVQSAVFIPGTAAKNYATKGNEYYVAFALNYRF